MSINFDCYDKLDFSDIDLTPPNKVVEEIASEFEKATRGIVKVRIEEYKGHVFSYTQSFGGIAKMLGETTKEYNIQKDLGRVGSECHKYEVYLYAPVHENYKFRVFFLQYGIASYPVKVVLEQSVAKSIKTPEYILNRDDRNGFEELVERILNSNAVLSIVQELIRVNQIHRKKAEEFDEEI